MNTKRPKIEIGTTFPHFWQDRFVNAEVVSRRKEGGRWLWTVRLTESQQPIVRESGFLSGSAVEWEYRTERVASLVKFIQSLPTFGPSRQGSAVVQWVDFGPSINGGVAGLWTEVREDITHNNGRNTHWTKSEYGTAEELLASGDAVRVEAET